MMQAGHGSLAIVLATAIISRQTTNCWGIHWELKKDFSSPYTPWALQQISLVLRPPLLIIHDSSHSLVSTWMYFKGKLLLKNKMFWWVWVRGDRAMLAPSCGHMSRLQFVNVIATLLKIRTFFATYRGMDRGEAGVVLYFSNALSFPAVCWCVKASTWIKVPVRFAIAVSWECP